MFSESIQVKAEKELEIKKCIGNVIEPISNRPLSKLGWVKNVKTDNNSLKFNLELLTPCYPYKQDLINSSKESLSSLSWLDPNNIDIEFITRKPCARPTDKQSKYENMKNISNIIAVSSCKGGVGKSTVSVNLAYSLKNMGARVGLLDCDLYGPSLPTLLHNPNDKIMGYDNSYLPLNLHGVKCMSFGYMTNPNSANIMRGPMIMQIMKQLATNTLWGDLDYLVLDMPPGTGDIQLSLCQDLSISSSVTISTPQSLSLIDTYKGIRMFTKMKVPVDMYVENMAYFKCNHNEIYYPFGKGNIDHVTKHFCIPTSMQLPLNQHLSQEDELPVSISNPNSEIGLKFKEMAEKISLEILKSSLSPAKPSYTVQYRKDDNSILFRKMFGTQAQQFSINPYQLRNQCKCAKCVDEFTGEQIYNGEHKDVVPLAIDYEGNYGINVQWSDNHSSIYSYDSLEKLDH